MFNCVSDPAVQEQGGSRKVCGKNLLHQLLTYKRICQYDEYVLKHYLGQHFIIPPSATNLSRYRVIDMYTRCTETSVREAILSTIDGNLRVTNMFCTVSIALMYVQFGQLWQISSHMFKKPGEVGEGTCHCCRLLKRND